MQSLFDILRPVLTAPLTFWRSDYSSKEKPTEEYFLEFKVLPENLMRFEVNACEIITKTGNRDIARIELTHYPYRLKMYEIKPEYTFSIFCPGSSSSHLFSELLYHLQDYYEECNYKKIGDKNGTTKAFNPA